MDFVVRLPVASNRHDSKWVIVDRLTKTAYFILVRANYYMDKLALVYVVDIIRLQGALVTIVSNKGPQFTLMFYGLQNELGTRLDFSTTFHLRQINSKKGPYRLWRIC